MRIIERSRGVFHADWLYDSVIVLVIQNPVKLKLSPPLRMRKEITSSNIDKSRINR